ncbi:MAG TPA: FAD:protein FMN transferase [Acidimicrobiales bacterium]|jgi:thiamine biosynthesis lipoprotein|nr:FAD:protein FMN transferase [Acidimicrobiales bacterium]
MTTLDAHSFPALGTTAVLIAYPPEAVASARTVLDEELGAIDAACSRFRDDSELVGLNRSAGRWVDVSPLLVIAVTVALRAARQTDGAVDPTVGTSLRLLGYDRDFAQLAPTGPPLKVTVAAVPGWQQVQVDEVGGRVRLPAGVEIDLGATAKALAADRAALRAWTATGAGVLVGLGGDLAMAGTAPPGGWVVRVTDDHRAPVDAPGQTVNLHGGGLATSSTVVRAWRRGDDHLHHIVDPATGRPAAGPWRTVSVAASSCVDANTAATAALVRGEGAPDWLEAMGLPSRLVAHDGHIRTVGGWPAEPS